MNIVAAIGSFMKREISLGIEVLMRLLVHSLRNTDDWSFGIAVLLYEGSKAIKSIQKILQKQLPKAMERNCRLFYIHFSVFSFEEKLPMILEFLSTIFDYH